MPQQTARHSALPLAASAALLLLLAGQIHCQETDGDEQFQAYHQDIGRISTSGAQVAPQTNIVINEPATSQLVSSTVTSSRARQQQQQSVLPRKANRVTLAVRRDPQDGFQQQLAPAAASVPLVSRQPAQTGASSVLPRHSILMAQVAAERAATPPTELPVDSFAGHQSHGHQQLQSQPAAQSFQSAAGALEQPAVSLQQPQHLAAAAQLSSAFVDQPTEPEVAPSFDQVLSRGCPGRGVFSWENKDHCDRYFLCTNGTFTEENCPNGLSYSQHGAVYQHCAYNWNVECAGKKSPGPVASAGCPWQFGIFPIESNGRCSIDYFVCEWGVPERKRCSPEGLFYDDRIKGCQWADQLGCKSESLLNFKCPAEDEANPYWPYPRYYHSVQDVVVCVNEQPRLVHCNPEQLVDPSSLACVDVKKKKKKF